MLYDDENEDDNEKHKVRESNYDGRISGFERAAKGWTITLTMTKTLYNLPLDNLQCTI